jgi:hypothetical protein
MKRLVLSVMLAVGVIGGWQVSLAQNSGTAVEVPALSAREKRVVSLLEETFYASRSPQIYADLRYAFGDLYLPVMKQKLAEDNPKADPEAIENLRLVVPMLEASLQAAKELEPALDEYRNAIFADIAAFLARHMADEEIAMAERMLRTPAARKSFNVVYAFSRLMTGYSAEDVRESQRLSDWMTELKFDLKTNPFTDKSAPPPPRERVSKAEALVTDFMRISRIDDMVADIVRFTRDVALQVETLKDEEREQISAGLQQFEFFYNLGKSMAIAMAPSGIAAALNDEQLGKFHLLILSPVMSKTFGLLHNVIREGTSYTKQDIAEFRSLAEEAETLKSDDSPEKQALMEREWQALTERWAERLRSRLSPETRTALESSIADLQAKIAEEEGEQTPDQPTESTPRSGQREL